MTYALTVLRLEYCTLLPSPGENINVNDIPDMKMELELFMQVRAQFIAEMFPEY